MGKDSKSKNASGQKSIHSIINPIAVTIAGTLLWASLHQPDIFNASTISIWTIRTLMVGCVIRAGLAVALPLFSIATAYMKRGFYQISKDGQIHKRRMAEAFDLESRATRAGLPERETKKSNETV